MPDTAPPQTAPVQTATNARPVPAHSANLSQSLTIAALGRRGRDDPGAAAQVEYPHTRRHASRVEQDLDKRRAGAGKGGVVFGRSALPAGMLETSDRLGIEAHSVPLMLLFGSGQEPTIAAEFGGNDLINIKVEELTDDRPFDNLDDYITQDQLRALSDRQADRRVQHRGAGPPRLITSAHKI